MKILVGSLDSMKPPRDRLACLLNSRNFLKISALFEQKLASAMVAKPNSTMDLNPPIILNHYSKIILPVLNNIVR